MSELTGSIVSTSTLTAYIAGGGDGVTAPHTHDDRYYTETQLGTSGQAAVHWDNLTDVPDVVGEPGPQGEPGPAGADGLSAYEVAVDNGFIGSEAEWLASLEGPQGAAGDPGPAGADGAAGADGLSAYEVAVAEGFVGDEAAWLASLVGPQGEQGPQGIQGEQGPAGEDGTGVTILGSYATEEDLETAHPTGNLGDGYLVAGDLYVWNGSAWQNVGTIQGPQGEQGPQGIQGVPGEQGPQGETGAAGADGDSAYDIAVAEGFVGTEAEWLDSLVGAQGPQGETGETGAAGPDGLSAYEVAVIEGGFIGSEVEWLASLVGEQGDPGAAGPEGDSAYQVAVDNGFVGTQEEWLATLVGPEGPQGVPGEVQFVDLAAVATSGDYADLTGTPAIPANVTDLADHVAGTFTPRVTDGADVAASATTALGWYVKISDHLMYVNIAVGGIDTTGLTSTAGVFIRGLPAAAKTATNLAFYNHVSVAGVTFSGYLSARMTSGFDYFVLYQNISNSATTALLISALSSGSAAIRISALYLI